MGVGCVSTSVNQNIEEMQEQLKVQADSIRRLQERGKQPPPRVHAHESAADQPLGERFLARGQDEAEKVNAAAYVGAADEAESLITSGPTLSACIEKLEQVVAVLDTEVPTKPGGVAQALQPLFEEIQTEVGVLKRVQIDEAPNLRKLKTKFDEFHTAFMLGKANAHEQLALELSSYADRGKQRGTDLMRERHLGYMKGMIQAELLLTDVCHIAVKAMYPDEFPAEEKDSD